MWVLYSTAGRVGISNRELKQEDLGDLVLNDGEHLQ